MAPKRTLTSSGRLVKTSVQLRVDQVEYLQARVSAERLRSLSVLVRRALDLLMAAEPRPHDAGHEGGTP